MHARYEGDLDLGLSILHYNIETIHDLNISIAAIGFIISETRFAAINSMVFDRHGRCIESHSTIEQIQSNLSVSPTAVIANQQRSISSQGHYTPVGQAIPGQSHFHFFTEHLSIVPRQQSQREVQQSLRMKFRHPGV